MAQRISQSEYNNQKTEYTKKSLAELNKQLNALKRNIHTIVDDDSEEEEEMTFDNIRKKKKTYEKEAHLEELLRKEETKSHYLILDLSNAKNELEVEKEKNKTLESLCSEWTQSIRLKLMLYLLVVNAIFIVFWYSVPFKERIFLSIPCSASLATSVTFYNYFQKIKNYFVKYKNA